MTDEVDELAARLELAEHAGRRVDGLEGQLRDARRRVERVLARLSVEEREVARLERPTLAWLAATVKGRRAEELTSEQADVDRVRLELAVAHRHVDAIAEQLAEVRTVASGAARLREQLATTLEATVAALDPTDPRAAALAELDERRRALLSQHVEVRQAITAASRAVASLDAVARALGTAGSWSTYDTFFGGGLIATIAKHGHLDDAAELGMRAQDDLRRLATELKDVTVARGLTLPELSARTRTMDAWFDNIFTDWSVHSQIREGELNVATVQQAVDKVARNLSSVVLPNLVQQLDALARERVELMRR